MGLFSSTKKISSSLVLNYPTYKFDEFKQTFTDFIASSECNNTLSSHGISLDGTLQLELAPDLRFEQTFMGEVPFSPIGSMLVGVREKGAKQGLALDVFTVEINFNLKKSEKKAAKEFMNELKKFYEKDHSIAETNGNAYLVAYSNYL